MFILKINNFLGAHLKISALVDNDVIKLALLDIICINPSGDLNPIVPTGDIWYVLSVVV